MLTPTVLCQVQNQNVEVRMRYTLLPEEEEKTESERFRIAFYHLESFPRMKYKKKISNWYLSVYEKKIYKQLYVKTSIDRWTSCKLRLYWKNRFQSFKKREFENCQIGSISMIRSFSRAINLLLLFVTSRHRHRFKGKNYRKKGYMYLWKKEENWVVCPYFRRPALTLSF